MKKKPLAAGFVFLLVVGLLAMGLSIPRKGAIARLAEIHNPEVGSMYVVGRYAGLILTGWDVAFFHKDTRGHWLGYYLAHEAGRWHKVSIDVQGSMAVVRRGSKTVAKYNAQTGHFAHTHSGVVFGKEDNTVAESELTKWGLVSTGDQK